jgi:hypothetical protein
MVECKFDPSVDMGGYVPLVKRLKGACRCSVCSKIPLVKESYVNDELVVEVVKYKALVA